MNARSNHLLNEVLSLPADERSALAEALLGSLDSANEPNLSDAWRAETQRRMAALRDGTITPVPWAAAKARLSAL